MKCLSMLGAFLGEGSEQTSQDTIRLVYSLGPLGYPLLPALNVFAPFRFKELHQHLSVSIQAEDRYALTSLQ